MDTMRAIVVDPESSGRLAIRKVEAPQPAPTEAVARVAAISLNRGEVRGVQRDAAGTRPGWDLAGTVERSAADGSGPKEGTRVVGMLESGAGAAGPAIRGEGSAADWRMTCNTLSLHIVVERSSVRFSPVVSREACQTTAV
jgi:NADPH:quinone reductase-like Zn-dependent oxidoreductase